MKQENWSLPRSVSSLLAFAGCWRLVASLYLLHLTPASIITGCLSLDLCVLVFTNGIRHWIKAHLIQLYFILTWLCKGVISKLAPIHRYQGLRLKCIILEQHNSTAARLFPIGIIQLVVDFPQKLSYRKYLSLCCLCCWLSRVKVLRSMCAPGAWLFF